MQTASTKASVESQKSVARESADQQQENRDGHHSNITILRQLSETVQLGSVFDAQSSTQSYRFRFFISVDWTPGQNIVMLDEGMDVQSLFACVQRKMHRKLEGKDLACVSFIIPEEEHLDVEMDDSEGWETVLEFVKEAGLSAVKGTVSRRD